MVSAHSQHVSLSRRWLLTFDSQSLSKQNDIIECSQTRQILERVEDDSSSLIALRETSSFNSSRATDASNSSLIDRKFSFDSEVLRSKVYQGQIRSLFRRALSRGEATHRTDALTSRRFIYDCGIYIQDGTSGAERSYSIRKARIDSDAPANYIRSSVCSRLNLRLNELPESAEYSCINTMHYQGLSVSHYADPKWRLAEPYIDTRDDVNFYVVDVIPKVQLQTMEDVLLFRPWHGPMVDVGRRELVPMPQSSSLPPSVQPWKDVDVVLKAALLPSSTRKNLRLMASRIDPSTLGEGRYVDGMMVWNGASFFSQIHLDGEQHGSLKI